MLNTLDEIIIVCSRIMWGPHMLLLLIGTGIYLTLRLRGLQFRRFLHANRYVLLGVQRKDKSQDKTGDITPLQALMTSLSSAVGNGNIVGVATAIAVGGPGAVFWMWICALVGMATKFSEVVLGVLYRKSNPDGTMMGGPMIYLQQAVRWKTMGKMLAGFSAFAMGIKVLFTTALMQSNSISFAFETQLKIPTWTTGIILAVITWLVIIGGIKSIGRFSEILAPFMSFVYVGAGLVIIAINWSSLPAMVSMIISDAFTGTAAAGGFAGSTAMMAIRFGVARGAQSNDAGNGCAAVFNAAAKTDQPVRQGLIAMMDVFIDTIIICTITASVILLTGQWLSGSTGAELAVNAFAKDVPFGAWVVVFSALLFGYSSLISNVYYGEQSLAYLFGFRVKKHFRRAFCVLIICGSIIKVNTVWLMADFLLGLMVLPNLIGLLAMSGIIAKTTKSYFDSLIAD